MTLRNFGLAFHLELISLDCQSVLKLFSSLLSTSHHNLHGLSCVNFFLRSTRVPVGQGERQPGGQSLHAGLQ